MRISFVTVLILTMFVAISSFAEEEKEGEHKDRVGPGKSVIAASEKDGFKLSEKVIKNFELHFQSVNGSVFSAPISALVHYQDFTAVYRLRDGWFRAIEIEPQIKGSSAQFTSKDFKPNDQIVVQNAGLLRIVELDVFGPEADAD